MIRVDDVACRELVELVTDYLEGALPADDRVRFEHHLVGCEPCEVYVEQIRSTIDAVGRVETVAPDTVPVELLDAYRAWKDGR